MRSQKIENFKAAVALHFGYYNFVKQPAPLAHSAQAAASPITLGLFQN
jgi:hypothetical protein